MSLIVLGPQVTTTPDTPPVVTSDGPLTQPLSWQWTSWDGTVWNLTDLASPVLKLRGATGAGMVDPEHTWTDAAALDGSTWEGARVGRGSVFLPLIITGRDSGDFLDNHRAFMRSLDPLREGTLRVTRPDGHWREIDCRYESGADLTIDLDPVAACQARYGITWATADPYWRGEPITPTLLVYEDQPAFLDPPGPPIILGSGRSLDSATTSNPGDVERHPVWRVGGPFTGFTVGVGDSLVSMTLTKAANHWVEIDTTPGRATILDESGVDQWLATTQRQFAPIPPGDNIPITTVLLSPASGASVSLTLTPKYRGGW